MRLTCGTIIISFFLFNILLGPIGALIAVILLILFNDPDALDEEDS